MVEIWALEAFLISKVKIQTLFLSFFFFSFPCFDLSRDMEDQSGNKVKEKNTTGNGIENKRMQDRI